MKTGRFLCENARPAGRTGAGYLVAGEEENLLHIVIERLRGGILILGEAGLGMGPPLLCYGALFHLFMSAS